MRTVSAAVIVILASGGAFAQEPGAEAALAEGGSGAVSADGYGQFEPGFEAGLRVGVGVPVGKAGETALLGDVDVEELAPLRAPAWIDVGYRISERTTLGVYGQIGFGATGDLCVGQCDWSDLRVGVQGQWRLADAGASLKPWFGLGLGYESLSHRAVVVVPLGEDREVVRRATERLGGPELLLQLGLDFRVEDSLDIGPYLSATLGHYMNDDLTCDPRGLCDDVDLIDASGVHSWLGIGLRGSYLP